MNTKIKILDARLSYLLDAAGKFYSNFPQLELLIDKDPPAEEFRFKQDGRAHYANLDGFVIVWYHDGDGRNEKGMGGRSWDITMEDGTPRKLTGPWCGNAAQFYTDTTKEFGLLVDVHHTDNKDDWEKRRGLTFGYWITFDRVREACKLIRPVEDNDDFSIIPVMIDEHTNPDYPHIDFALMKTPRGNRQMQWGKANAESDIVLTMQR